MAKRTLAAVMIAAAMLTTACTERIFDTGQHIGGQGTSSPAPTTPSSNANLVNAFDYYVVSDTQKGYYFTTPGGQWNCAIVPRDRAGCQSTSGSSLGIPGEPETVEDADGQERTPNVILLTSEGDPHFAWQDKPEFDPTPGPAKALEPNKILAAAGFRCNLQDSRVSCLSELNEKGFTISDEGFTLSYTDVPPR